MSWRLRFSDRPIETVDLLAGDPRMVAVIGGPPAIHFFDVVTGADYGSLRISPPPTHSDPGSPAWRAYTDRLHAPNGAFLSSIDSGPVTVHFSRDGLLHLYHFHDGRLLLEVDGQTGALVCPGKERVPVAVAMDPELGTVGVLDDHGWLHLYQQRIYVGGYPIHDGLISSNSAILVPDAADHIWIIDSERIQAVDMAGTVLARRIRDGASGPSACSPDGQLLIEAESRYDRLTAYDSSLQPILRGSISNLLLEAAPVQLFEETIPAGTEVTALAVANDGDVALAVGGTLCVTTLDFFTPLPRPRLLL